jgi:LytS/YehU family sensor histidine kinase
MAIAVTAIMIAVTAIAMGLIDGFIGLAPLRRRG